MTAPQPAQLTRLQKILLGVTGALVGALALLALFVLGTRLPGLLGAAPAVAPATPSAPPSPAPTPTMLPPGPVAPGVYDWDALLGGECLEPFTDPWAQQFTVVDCQVPHAAQLVARGRFEPPAPAAESTPAPFPYPGQPQLEAQLEELCTSDAVIDYAAAGQYANLQVQATFPATSEQWDAGERSYFCFVTRSTQDKLTASIAVAY